MYGYIAGITNTDEISYCPKCSAKIKKFIGDDTAVCKVAAIILE